MSGNGLVNGGSGHCHWEAEQDADNPNVNLAPLTAMVDEQDHLQVGGCDVLSLVQEYDSPLYIVDERTVRQAYHAYQSALSRHYSGPSKLHYASKANCCLALVSLLNGCGAGIDVVSDGELTTCLAAKVPAEDILFHGNNKSYAEVHMAVKEGATLVLDNFHELRLIERATKALGRSARVHVRVTPGIECHTHEYIQTGHLDSKFGFDPNDLPKLLAKLGALRDSVILAGFHGHIGSQIFELQPHRDLAEFLVKTVVNSWELGFSDVRDINMGGGLGIRYVRGDDPPTIAEWVRVVCKAVQEQFAAHGIVAADRLPRLLVEPGRSMIGTACITAYRAGATKTVPGVRDYISVDGGMSDNPRPITYQASYTALLARAATAVPAAHGVRLTGKHCEEGDIIIHDASLPPVEADDVIAVLSSGAYHMSMASNYNRVCRPAMILVADGNVDVIQRRETFADLLSRDQVPRRLALS